LISARPNWSLDWASCWMSVFMAATVSMARTEIRWLDRAGDPAHTSGTNFIAVMNNANSEPRITPSLRPSPKMQAPTLTSAAAEPSDTPARECSGYGISDNWPVAPCPPGCLSYYQISALVRYRTTAGVEPTSPANPPSCLP
jgi:hypothetical protein